MYSNNNLSVSLSGDQMLHETDINVRGKRPYQSRIEIHRSECGCDKVEVILDLSRLLIILITDSDVYGLFPL